MLRFPRLVASLAIVALCSGCASIVSGTNQSLSITSSGPTGTDVSGARCTLVNDKGTWYATTPGSVTVHRSFNDLAVTCTLDGLEPGVASIKSSTKGMAAGNLLFGGLIGVGVDVSSGAAYDYPTVIRISMGQPAGGVPGSTDAPGSSSASATIAAAAQAVPPRPVTPNNLLPVGTRITFQDSDPITGNPLGESTFVVSDGGAEQLAFNDGAIVVMLDGTPVKGLLHGTSIYGTGPQQMTRGGNWTGRFRVPQVSTDVPVEISMLRLEERTISGKTFQAARLSVHGFATREVLVGQATGSGGAAFRGEMLVDKATGLVLDIKVTSRNGTYSLRRSVVRIASG